MAQITILKGKNPNGTYYIEDDGNRINGTKQEIEDYIEANYSCHRYVEVIDKTNEKP
jgi:hypothetical protein